MEKSQSRDYFGGSGNSRNGMRVGNGDSELAEKALSREEPRGPTWLSL